MRGGRGNAIVRYLKGELGEMCRVAVKSFIVRK